MSKFLKHFINQSAPTTTTCETLTDEQRKYCDDEGRTTTAVFADVLYRLLFYSNFYFFWLSELKQKKGAEHQDLGVGSRKEQRQIKHVEKIKQMKVRENLLSFGSRVSKNVDKNVLHASFWGWW